MAHVSRHFVGLVISLIVLRVFAHPIDLNTIAEDHLVAILHTNGVRSDLIRSLVFWRQKNGWIWSYEELLLCGVPEESLSWFRYHFILPQPLPLIEYSSDAADFLLYPVDLNSASSSALSLLPGIDEERVRKILIYREKKGFDSPRDLLSLGWKEEEIQHIAPFITVSPPPNTMKWHHGLRIEGTNLLYRSTLALPSFETYLLLPEPQNITKNLFTLQTQAVMGIFLSPSWGKIIIGDLVYRQGMGLISGNPFSIISRHPSEMIPWEKGLLRPYSAKRDQNKNHYDEILRGIAFETWWEPLSIGGILSSNQMTLAGGWLTTGTSETK
ncbi:MAG: helix-hairpin-helix domain-containing protein, partial [Brevinematales bacterium]